jgi:hypothetical protein
MVDAHGFSEAGRKARFERWEKLGCDQVKHDLLNGGYRVVGGPPQERELAWEWVRMKEAEQLARSSINLADLVEPPSTNLDDLVGSPRPTLDDLVASASSHRQAQAPASVPRPASPPPPKAEIVTLKPSLYGMSIDLKELGRRGLNWWRGLSR